MSAAKAPHQGYNHNVRHQGHVFHVQTEDSGGRNPHIETHVFYEGVILSSRRTPYADFLSGPNPDSAVRRLMQEQHKGLLKDLRSGTLDDRIAEALAKHKKKTPREETVPFGMKPLKEDGKTPPSGDLPVAAPPDARARRAATPVPVARPPVAAPPVRRGDGHAAPAAGTRQAGVVVSRPVHVVSAARSTSARAAAPSVSARPALAVPAAASSPATPTPRPHDGLSAPNLEALILRYLIEDLERGE